MQTTEHYALNLFEGTDHVLAENFNANTEILDAALAGKINGTSFTYTGSGQKRNTITFPAKPLFAVIAVYGSTPQRWCFITHGCSAVLHSSNGYWGNQSCSWEGNALTLDVTGTGNSAEEVFNVSGKTYRVTALLE